MPTLELFGDFQETLAYYNDFKASDRNRFPFSGGRLEQPEWVLHNLGVLALVDEWITLGRELKVTRNEWDDWDELDLSGVEGLPDDTIQQDDTSA